MSKAATTFSRTVDGRTQTRIAYSPDEAVKLRFDGWREVADETKTKQPTAPTTSSGSGSENTASK